MAWPGPNAAYLRTSVWELNPGTTERLTELWSEGLSASQIAALINSEFGTFISRNAVIAKRARIGLPGRPSPITRTGKERKARALSKSRLEFNNGRNPRRYHVRRIIDTQAPKQCQYIAGTPSADDACKCNKPTIEGASYCAEHHAICIYVRPAEAVLA